MDFKIFNNFDFLDLIIITNIIRIYLTLLNFLMNDIFRCNLE